VGDITLFFVAHAHNAKGNIVEIYTLGDGKKAHAFGDLLPACKMEDYVHTRSISTEAQYVNLKKLSFTSKFSYFTFFFSTPPIKLKLG
jgi:hypothetical protein